MIMDILDDIMYYTNFIGHVLGRLKQATSSSKAGRFGPTVRVSVPRSDKTPGGDSLNEVTSHLEDYGVTILGKVHDSQSLYFWVRKSQESQMRALYDEQNGRIIYGFKHAWADGLRPERVARYPTMADDIRSLFQTPRRSRGRGRHARRRR